VGNSAGVEGVGGLSAAWTGAIVMCFGVLNGCWRGGGGVRTRPLTPEFALVRSLAVRLGSRSILKTYFRLELSNFFASSAPSKAEARIVQLMKSALGFHPKLLTASGKSTVVLR
jgi:hypothetical protein